MESQRNDNRCLRHAPRTEGEQARKQISTDLKDAQWAAGGPVAHKARKEGGDGLVEGAQLGVVAVEGLRDGTALAEQDVNGINLVAYDAAQLGPDGADQGQTGAALGVLTQKTLRESGGLVGVLDELGHYCVGEVGGGRRRGGTRGHFEIAIVDEEAENASEVLAVALGDAQLGAQRLEGDARARNGCPRERRRAQGVAYLQGDEMRVLGDELRQARRHRGGETTRQSRDGRHVAGGGLRDREVVRVEPGLLEGRDVGVVGAHVVARAVGSRFLWVAWGEGRER